MGTRVLCTFGCYVQPTTSEQATLDVADVYRHRLCKNHQKFFEGRIECRNTHFPRLYSLLQAWELAKARIHELEKSIRQTHIQERDRNAMSEADRNALVQARADCKALGEQVTQERKYWYTTLAAFAAYWQTLTNWKSVKNRDKRRALYEQTVLPEESEPYVAALRQAAEAAAKKSNAKRQADGQPPQSPRGVEARLVCGLAIAAYGRLWMEYDLAERALDEQFTDVLHSAIRAEIKEASQIKAGPTAPGMRYFYGRPPRPTAWQKLSLHFGGGGQAMQELLDGETKTGLTLERAREKSDGSVFYRVTQQIGTAKHPCRVSYMLHADRPIPPDSLLKRWTMVIRENGKREVMLTLGNLDTQKPVDAGVLAYRLSWTRRKSGIEVARFWGEHVQERLLLPNRLVELRQAAAQMQTKVDDKANACLVDRGAFTKTCQGLTGLQKYVLAHPYDNGAANLLDACQRRMHLAQKTSQRAIRCIEHIFEVVTSRVCRRHAQICHHAIDLQQLARDTKRDLLQEDTLPLASRTLRQLASPGKLRELLCNYGLEEVEDVPAEPDFSDDAVTDVFTSYVESLKGKYGTKRGPSKKFQTREAG